MFKHADQALRFAFRMRQKDLISKPSLTPSQKEKSPAERLSAHDFHAQAGMLFSFLERRPLHEQCYAFLMYGDDRERDASASILSADLALPKHIRDRGQLKIALLSKTVRGCAKELGISTYKAWRTKQALHGMLEPLGMRLFNAVEDWFGIAQ